MHDLAEFLAVVALGPGSDDMTCVSIFSFAVKLTFWLRGLSLVVYFCWVFLVNVLTGYDLISFVLLREKNA